jgi:hypothetical protein
MGISLFGTSSGKFKSSFDDVSYSGDDDDDSGSDD